MKYRLAVFDTPVVCIGEELLPGGLVVFGEVFPAGLSMVAVAVAVAVAFLGSSRLDDDFIGGAVTPNEDG